MNIRAAGLALVLMALVPFSSASIFSWFCNTGNCAAGSCSANGNLTEGSCSRSPAGTYSMVKASCIANPTSSQMCVSVAMYGPASIMPGGEADCVSSIEVIESFPCDTCLPIGPHGTPAKFACGYRPAYGTNFSYNCNVGCSFCINVAAVDTNFVEVDGYYTRALNVFSCPTVISYQEYAGETCDSVPGAVKYYVPGLANCNGYTKKSNANANLFTCI